MTDIHSLKDRFSRIRGKIDSMKENLKIISLKIEKNNARIKNIENAQALIQHVAKETQSRLKFHIEDIVQSALDTCFPGKYTFIAEFVLKRGRTEVSLYLEKDGEKVNPIDSSGGGVVDVICFALRLVAWGLDSKDNVIILDEPFKFLSVNLRPLAGQILKELSDRLKLQIIMITHDNEMVNIADKVFPVNLINKISKI